MSILDDLLTAGVSTANNSIMETRSNVSRNLTGLVMNALPKTNRIPGPLGGFAENLSRKVTSSITSPITDLLNPNVMLNPAKAVVKLGDGVNQVLDTIGVPSNTQVQQLNPRIYQNAATAAKGVWSQIETGNKDVSQIVSSAQEPLSLLKYTHDNYTNSIDNLAANDSTQTVNPGTRPTPYAMDLFRLAPKHKFLFVVEFVFNGGYDFIGAGQQSKNDFAITIRDFDRPNVQYDYEDNVNFYNFRTPVIKRVVHDPLTIKFLDDRQNLAMQFFHNYLKATHPLTNVDVGSAFGYESNGMNFNSKSNSSSVGILQNDLVNILKEIKVYHLYDFGSKMNVHHFVNPKVVGFQHDSWNMVDSEGSYITAKFVYDAWTMELGVDVGQSEADTVGTLSNSGHYKIQPIQTSAASNGNAFQNSVDLNDVPRSVDSLTDQLFKV